jgi:hypothetical protein
MVMRHSLSLNSTFKATLYFKVDDVSALEASSNRSVRIVEDTSQHHCISNVCHDPGYGLDAVT